MRELKLKPIKEHNLENVTLDEILYTPEQLEAQKRASDRVQRIHAQEFATRMRLEKERRQGLGKRCKSSVVERVI